MTSLFNTAHICVGLSFGVVAPAFGKHVHPTGHLAPIMVLSGRGIPELVSSGAPGLKDGGLVSISMTVMMKTIRVVIKRKIANPSI